MAKTANLVDPSGRPVPLGTMLGSGGEGDVYDVPSIGPDFVAKVYHETVKPQKQEKLRGMVQRCDDQLKRIAAWPLMTLHHGRTGPVAGFLMPKVAGYLPVHMLYSPAHRKSRFPKADWAFLINTARNLAAAFDAIHTRGHVIGDVNQGNVVVAPNSIVKLIDCDSFQIVVNGNSYLCEVGVPHFTPPELQNAPSFEAIRRTSNHDNFGLAVLCFHLLFLGRHPFSGVYSGRDDMPIEKSIAGFRFAFGRNASTKNMSPPPNSLGLSIIPSSLANLFERAFGEVGSQSGNRPSAREWMQHLDELKGSLRACSHEAMHKFYGKLGGCPWCAFESRVGILFFIGAPGGGRQTTFDLDSLWRRIMAITPPVDPPIPVQPSNLTPVPKPLPPALVQAKHRAVALRVLAVGVFIGVLLIHPGLIFVGLIIAGAIWASANVNNTVERRARQDVLLAAQNRWGELERRWRQEAGSGAFMDQMAQLKNLKAKYEQLDEQYARQRQELKASVRLRQLEHFLAGFHIDDYRIPNIGPGRKVTLASFGIETAADIDPAQIRQIRGFGESLTYELVKWRRSLEASFTFDPTKGVDPADIAALDQKFHQQRAQIMGDISAGCERLNQIKTAVGGRRETLRHEIQVAAQALAQAQADMRMVA